MNATTNKIAVKDERWYPELGTFFHQLTRTPGQLDIAGPSFLGDTDEARERTLRFGGCLGEFVGIDDPVAEVRRLREIERQWNAVHDAQARTVEHIREGLQDEDSLEEVIQEAILYGCGEWRTSSGSRLLDELADSGALKDIAYLVARRVTVQGEVRVLPQLVSAPLDVVGPPTVLVDTARELKEVFDNSPEDSDKWFRMACYVYETKVLPQAEEVQSVRNELGEARDTAKAGGMSK